MPVSSQESQIGALYVSYFGRASDPAGLAYWVDRLNNGMSLVDIANSFAVQPEAIAQYSFLANPTPGGTASFVGSVYTNLFIRTSDPAGLQFWIDQVNGGNAVGRVIQDMISGAQGNDLLTVQDKVTVGVTYAQQFASSGKTWTSSNLDSAKAILVGVTFDPTTVTTADNLIPGIIAATPTPTPNSGTMTLTVPGESVNLNGFTSTINLSGADLATYPAVTFGTVALAANAGITSVNNTSTATLSASGNAAATTYNFSTGVVGGTDAVNATLTYTGFTTYVASSHGDTVTLSAAVQNVTGGAGNDTLILAVASYTGTSNLNAGANLLDVKHNGATDLSNASLAATGGTLALVFDGTAAQNIAMTSNEYNSFNAAGITDGANTTAANSTVTLTTSTAIADTAAVNNYVFGGNNNNSFTVANNTTLNVTVSAVANPNQSFLDINTRDVTIGTLLVSGLTTGTVTIGNLAAGNLGITNLTLAGAVGGTLTINESGAGSVTIGTGATYGGSIINLNNTGSGTLTVSGLTDNAATTVALGTGTTSLTLSDSSAALVVNGSTNNANDAINLTAGTSGTTVTLGNGNNTISIADGTATHKQFVTLGSGTNSLTWSAAHGVDELTFSVANGGSSTFLTTVTNSSANDIIIFKNAAADAATTHQGAEASIAHGVTDALANATSYTDFTFGGNTFVYQRTGSTANDQLVAIVGSHVGVGLTAAIYSLG